MSKTPQDPVSVKEIIEAMKAPDFDFQNHTLDEAERKKNADLIDLTRERQEQIEQSQEGKTVDPEALTNVGRLLLEHLVAREAAAQAEKSPRP